MWAELKLFWKDKTLANISSAQTFPPITNTTLPIPPYQYHCTNATLPIYPCTLYSCPPSPQELKGEMEAKKAAIHAFMSFGSQLLAQSHYASTIIRERLDTLSQDITQLERWEYVAASHMTT